MIIDSNTVLLDSAPILGAVVTGDAVGLTSFFNPGREEPIPVSAKVVEDFKGGTSVAFKLQQAETKDGSYEDVSGSSVSVALADSLSRDSASAGVFCRSGRANRGSRSWPRPRAHSPQAKSLRPSCAKMLCLMRMACTSTAAWSRAEITGEGKDADKASFLACSKKVRAWQIPAKYKSGIWPWALSARGR